MGRRATDSGATKAVAIKLMAQRFADQPAYERMFAAEARLSMLLNHSTIVQVFDVGRVDDTAFLVMEWVDGLNLAQIAAYYRKTGKGRLPVQVVGYVVGEILRALDYAHTLVHEGEPLRIVHRDVSPQNVLVSVSGEVKLTDFGVARLAMDETSGVHVKGKLRYMPREQLAGQSHHPGVDLYAVGAILHEMLSGEKFRAGAKTELELAAMAASTEIPSLLVEDVPWEIEELRVGLLQPDPRHRVQSAAEALRMLERWPGFRNAAAQLGTICRQIMGVSAPRSGLFDVRRDLEVVPTGVRPRATPAQAESDSAAETRQRPAAVDEEETERSRRAPPVTVAAGLALAVAMVGGGGYLVSKRMGLVGEGRGGSPEVGAGAASAAAQPSAPETTGDRASIAAAAVGGGVRAATVAPDAAPKTSAVAPSSGTGAPPDPEVAPLQAPGEPGAKAVAPGPAKTSKPRARKPRVPITFGLRGPRLAFVRVDKRRTYVLQPIAKAKLTAGRHRVEWRLSREDPWRPGGVIVLAPGKRYDLRVLPEGVELSEVRN